MFKSRKIPIMISTTHLSRKKTDFYKLPSHHISNKKIFSPDRRNVKEIISIILRIILYLIVIIQRTNQEVKTTPNLSIAHKAGCPNTFISLLLLLPAHT